MCNQKHKEDKVDDIVSYNMGRQQQREHYIDCGDSGIKKLKYGDNIKVPQYINR